MIVCIMVSYMFTRHTYISACRFLVLLIGVLWLSPPHAAYGQWRAGRNLEDRPTFSIGISGGAMFDLDGEVREIDRPLYAYTDDHSGAAPEDYSWDELGFDDQYLVVGIMLEKMWRFVSLGANAFYGNPSVRGIADRDYYIGVESVRWEGETYEHLVIPEGQEYRGDIRAGKLDLYTRITPVSYETRRGTALTPWIHAGLFLFVGDYEIDAGEARDLIQYERPPRDYVVGGEGSGTAWVVIPEIGLGGEIRMPLGASTHFSLQANYALFKFSGRSGDIGISSRHEKSLNVDYHTFGFRGQLEHQVGRRVELFAGVEFARRSGDAEIRAKDRPTEEVLELREKFDKDVHFQVSTVLGFVGLRF